MTSHVDQYTEPIYSSTTNDHTPTSTELVSTINNPNEQEDIWNIFEQISSQTNLESSRHDYNSIRYQPYETHYQPYSSPIIQCHTPSIYPTFQTPYQYSSLHTHTNQKRLKRRKCYGCRQQGHLRKECPYFSHE
jgi:hypothetical protein